MEGGGSGVGDAEAVNGGDNHIVDENGVKRVPCDICGVLLLEQCVKQHILQVINSTNFTFPYLLKYNLRAMMAFIRKVWHTYYLKSRCF